MTPYAFLANLQYTRERLDSEGIGDFVEAHRDDLALALQQAERAERETTPTRAQVEALPQFTERVYVHASDLVGRTIVTIERSAVLALYAPVQPSAGDKEQP